jgi:hypothetical protein
MPEIGKPSNGYVRTILGFKSGGAPDMYHGPRDWEDWKSNNNNTARNEDFADMFMKWAFDTFADTFVDNSPGNLRMDWMTTNMAEWLK